MGRDQDIVQFKIGFPWWMLFGFSFSCAPTSCESAEASADCPSFEEAIAHCRASNSCWEYKRDGRTSGTVGYGQTNAEVGADNSAGCSVACTTCATMVETPALPMPEDDLGRTILSFAHLVCDRRFECNPFSWPWLAGEKAHCVSVVDREYLMLAKLPRTGVNADTIAACATSSETNFCGDKLTCFRGEGESGAACMSPVQCASEYCTGSQWACGVCAPWPEPTSLCASHAECPGYDDACFQGVCTPYRKEGESCADGMSCAVNHDCVDGICFSRQQALNEPCGPEKGLPYCQPGEPLLGCDAEEHVCKAATVAAPGEPCPAFGWCGASGACFDGICRAGPGPSEGCDASKPWPVCRWPYECVGGRCSDLPQRDVCE